MKEKNDLKKELYKRKTKKGISLIVLIVTIIVIIILAVAVIITVGKNNPVESAREAKFKEDIQTFRDDLVLSISKDYTASAGQRDNKFSGITYEEIKNYIPSFTKEYEGKIIVKDDELMYPEDIENRVISQKEKEWLKEAEIKEYAKTAAEKVYEDTSYYGKSITNYSANGVDDWKIFYSDGNNIYIIASDYVDVEKLPAPLRGGSKPANTYSSYPKQASLSNVYAGYNGSENIIDEKIKKLNSDYFDKGYASTSTNMRLVAYILDKTIWSSFAGEKAEYAIGGPTIEMLTASYNKKHNTKYKARASSNVGYEISTNGGGSWNFWCSNMLDKNDSLYVLPKNNGATGMWIASPSFGNSSCVIYTRSTGNVGGDYYTDYETYAGFRPLICLSSNVLFEEDGEGYKIK